MGVDNHATLVRSDTNYVTISGLHECVVYKDHYYHVYRALLQMVKLILNEWKMDCRCKQEHTKYIVC